MRFFNSLCETETKLKEAIQPRYLIETGLVKLVEMRRVVAVEELLERLGRLEQTLAGSAGQIEASQNASAASAEKKTLDSGPALPEPEPEPEPPVYERPVSEPPIFDEPPPVPPAAPIVDLSFIDDLPIKLAPIDSEALEHVEDTWLDAAYDRKLIRSGDDLAPLVSAPALVQRFTRGAAGQSPATNGSNGTGLATATAIDPTVSAMFAAPVFAEESDDQTDPGDLPANASEEELRAYVSRHPTARRVMRIFRATVVEVKPSPSDK